ncbi:MAG: TonB-dependent receptor [Bacteroidaceae bacterium]|nr:TonB-dependent receptor [Bacteroidaceae bacterium]
MKKTLLAIALTLTSISAFAEELTDTSRVADLDELIIVSQPKDLHLLRQQPLSSTLFAAEDLSQLNIQTMAQLSDFVPTFAVPAYGSRYTSSIYVRGIGSRVNSPAVGLYIDNIPVVSKSMLNFHLYELERADVLRGPQGTLYGQNTEGGLIRMYTRQPLTYQGTDVNLSFGTGLQRKAEVAHYNKVNDQLGFSLAAFYQGQQGFFDNTTNGEHADKMDEAGGRARLQWKPAKRFGLDLTADYQYTSQNGFPYGEMTASETLDPYSNRQGNYKRHMLTTGLAMNYALDRAELGSMTSWQYLNDDMLMDIDYRPLDYMHMTQAQLQNAITQEFTAKSKTDGIWRWTNGAFYTYQALKTNAPVYFDSAMNDYLSQTIEDYAYYGMLNSMAKRMGMEAAKATIERAGGCHIRMDMATAPGMFRTPTHNFGLFHQSEIDITPHLTATLGLRYDLSHVAIDYNTVGAVSLDESVMGVNVKANVRSELKHKEKATFNQLLPKVGLTYRLSDSGSNLYALVAKGYRAGGYNIQMFSDILQTELQGVAQTARGDMEIEHTEADYENMRHTIAFKPEESWNYEFGTHLNLFDSKVQFDFAGYYMQIRNQQLSVMAGNYGFGRMMVNAGRSYSCGIEAALRGRALDNHLAWGINYGYTRAVFKEYTDSISGDEGMVAVDYKDKRVPFVPEHTLAANVDYQIDFSSPVLRSLTIGANLTMRGKTYWDNDNLHSQPIYALLGARIDADFGKAVLSLWGRNITNTTYNTFATDSRMAGETLYFAQRGNPLQVGIDLRIHF